APTTRRAWTRGSMRRTSTRPCARPIAPPATRLLSPLPVSRSSKKRPTRRRSWMGYRRKRAATSAISSAAPNGCVARGRRQKRPNLIVSVPDDPTQALDRDQWWIERRFVSRTLLDLGDAKTAYRVASAAAVPSRQNYRVEHQFTSGWIALRFLNDASTAFA